MILFENVSKKYRGTQRPALDNINFEITRGEFVFIVGASGSGKSSCLRLILREEQPTGGQIHVLGHDLGKISSRKVPYFRRNLGVVFQDFRLLTNKTVYDNVAFSLQVIGKSRGFIQEAVPDTLKMVGLEGKEKRYPHELSGGEQQRVAIARAIVNKPSVLLADEPTGNLDPATSLGIMQLLRAINAAGTTIVMATHEAAFVDIMQQRVIEISQGVVVRDEQRGGYGETAAIPLVDLSQAGTRTMRTSDEFVRQTLAPQSVAAAVVPPSEAAAAVAAAVPAAELTAEGTESAPLVSATLPASMPQDPVTVHQAVAEPATPEPVVVEQVAPVLPVSPFEAVNPADPSSVLPTPVAAEPRLEAATADASADTAPASAASPAVPPMPALPEPTQAPVQARPSTAPVRDIPDFLKPAPAAPNPVEFTVHEPQPDRVVAPEVETTPTATAAPVTAPVAFPAQAEFAPQPEATPQAGPMEDPLDRTVRSEEHARTQPAVPHLTGEERDPVRLAEQGGWAKLLGLNTKNDDDQTDVGPVR